MSSVQSIRRAFAVLGALGDGAARRDRRGRTHRPAEVDGGPVARHAGRRRRGRAGPGRHRSTGSGPRLVTLRPGSRLARSLAALARPTLAELAEASGEAAGLAIPDGDLAHYIDQVDTPNPVRSATGPGPGRRSTPSRRGRCCWPSGRRPRSSAISRGPLERFTARTLADPGAVRERLQSIRRNGFTWAIEEFDPGISSVAAPIADAIRGGRGGASISTGRLPIPDGRPRDGAGPARAGRRGADRGRTAGRVAGLAPQGPARRWIPSGGPASRTAAGARRSTSARRTGPGPARTRSPRPARPRCSRGGAAPRS